MTHVLNVAGNLARIGTLLHEVDDQIVLASSVSALVQNTLLVGQILMLGGMVAPTPSKDKKRKE